MDCYPTIRAANATYRIELIGVCLFACFFCASAWSVERSSTVSGTVGDISIHGISVAVLPTDARPGDVVELRIEMSRDSWGRFELGKLIHPQMRIISHERIPVTYRNRGYHQRHSVFFQPMSSGIFEIGETSVNLSTSGGEEIVELPKLKLNVIPFDALALSNSPLALPPDEVVVQSSSMVSAIFWAGFACSVLGLWSLVFFGMRNRKFQSVRVDSSGESTRSNGIIENLRAGIVPKRELENLLHDSNFSISAELRNKIEQAVYSLQFEPNELADVLREELRK